MNMPIVSMRGVNKSFETETVETRALIDLDLEIREKEFLSISGPSGCGKSTLLSILGLLDSPSSGEYLFDGRNVSDISANQAAEIRCADLGFVFQSFNLIDDLSVHENVGLPLRYLPTIPNKKFIEERVSWCLDIVGLSHRSSHKPNQLSGGQQQRVAIARALVGEPRLLLVDEPTGNLDSKSGDSIIEMLIELNRQGKTICLVTHDPRYANVANRRLNLIDGKIVHVS